MTDVGWLTMRAEDVPPTDEWLAPSERAVLDGFRFAKRRADWRLGRFTAKRAVGAWLGVDDRRITVLASADGAPDVYLDGAPAPVSLSISHRADRGLATVTTEPGMVGCDIELTEPRRDAFVREWFAPAEQEQAFHRDGIERDRYVCLLWTAKEAAAKLFREGLRLDVRHLIVDLSEGGAGWQRLQITPEDRPPLGGWWCEHDGYVLSTVSTPPSAPPRPIPLSGAGGPTSGASSGVR